MNNKRNGAIDLLKFLFCMMIVIYHGRKFAPNNDVYFGAGYIAVEFFFLVSGYLMTAKAYSVSKRENLLPGRETADFILKKFKTLFPPVLFAYVASVIVQWSIIANPQKFSDRLIYTVWEPFMLWMSGVGYNNLQINAQTWYISAMLISMFVLFPIMIKKFELFTRVIAPVTAILIFGWIGKEHGTLNLYRGWTGLIYSGNLRAVAALCLGSVCWVGAQRLQAIRFKKPARVLLALAEVACYLLIVYNANIPDDKRMAFILAALLAVGVTITFSKTSILGTCFDRKICYWLGNFSLTIYLHHIIIRKIFQRYDLGLSYKKELLIFVTATLAWSLAAHYILMGLQKLFGFIGKKLKPVLVETEEIA